MLLLKYDFYDIHAVLVYIRLLPGAPCNYYIVKNIKQVLTTPQIDNCIDDNIIRKALSGIRDLPDYYYWVNVMNAYTYGNEIIKEEQYYRFLTNAFNEMQLCIEKNEPDRLEDLADALHNIPIFMTDDREDFRKFCRIQFSYYKKKYGVNLWDKFTR